MSLVALFTIIIGGYLPALFFVSLAIILLVNPLVDTNNIFLFTKIFLISGAIPFSAYLAGLFLDYFSFKSSETIFSKLALPLAAIFIFQDSLFPSRIPNFLNFLLSDDISLNALLEIFNTIIFTSSLTAMTIMLAVLLLEMPINWLFSLKNANINYSFHALRPLAVIFILTYSFNLILSLFSQEFKFIGF